MSSEGAPIILPYKGVVPAFAAPAIHMGPGAAVLGRAELGRGAWLGARSVIRADGHYVRIGDDFRLGPCGTVHIAHDFLPTHVGANVAAGAGAVIHACDVGDDCHIGDRAIILDGSKVEAGCAIAPGSVVFPRRVLESGWLHGGAPAQPVRRLAPGELERLQAEARRQPEMPPEPRRGTPTFLRGANSLSQPRRDCAGTSSVPAKTASGTAAISTRAST